MKWERDSAWGRPDLYVYWANGQAPHCLDRFPRRVRRKWGVVSKVGGLDRLAVKRSATQRRWEAVYYPWGCGPRVVGSADTLREAKALALAWLESPEVG